MRTRRTVLAATATLALAGTLAAPPATAAPTVDVVSSAFGAPFNVAVAGGTAQVLDLVDLGWAAPAMPDQLSEGARKLVGVARALAGQPRLLCLDEPAAGLDARESEELGRSLRELADGFADDGYEVIVPSLMDRADPGFPSVDIDEAARARRQALAKATDWTLATGDIQAAIDAS